MELGEDDVLADLSPRHPGPPGGSRRFSMKRGDGVV